MSVIAQLKRKLVERRFKKRGWNIIQHIPTSLFHKIIRELSSQGWEVTCDYMGEHGWQDKGKCKVRKGLSVLVFEWNIRDEGTITGPDYITTDIADEFHLTNRQLPQW